MNAFVKFPKFQTNPFCLLLLTEWVMIVSCFCFAVVEYVEEQRIPIQHLLLLALLGLMGLALPINNPHWKVVYTIIELSLIFYGATLGYLHILPTLYLVVVIRSCFLFKNRGRWVIAGTVLILFLIHQIKYVRSIVEVIEAGEQQRLWMHLVAETLMFSLGVFFTLRFINTLQAERKAKEQLAAAHEQLQQYAKQAEDLAAAQERNRIARDIHDSLGHALTALNVQLQTGVKLLQHDPAKAQPFLEQAHRLGSTAMKEVRQSVGALRDEAQVEPPLEEAIALLVDNFRQGTGIATSANVCLNAPVPPTIVKTIYRIVQEALTNISKHAQASQVEIQVFTTANSVNLVIEDDGRGFNLEQLNGSGFGLQSMQQRVAAVDGNFQLKTEPGMGCRIAIKLPLKQSSTLLT
ncbi:MAG: sensor histidine kinase [Microcoleus sp. SIO2G3]|nr:sensor histidine kinase [Microcoleus sp. SIO2G3]